MEDEGNIRGEDVQVVITCSNDMSEPSGKTYCSSSTSSSQSNLDVPQDRRSNITILTDSSSDNWTLRKGMSKTVITNDNERDLQKSYTAIEKMGKEPVSRKIQADDVYIINSCAIANVEKNIDKVVNQLPCNKDIVKIRKASKFYGSGNNKKPVLSSLDLSIKEGDM